MTDDMPKTDLTPTNDGGVIKMVLKEGEGTEGPCKGNLVSVHYVGTLEDGTPFDSSRDRGDKFEFTLGKGEVIKAWDLCVASMKKGELCKVICKSPYAYGSTGSPPKIPPNATLIFEIELFSWKVEDLTIDQNGGITRKIITEGEGFSTPKIGASIKIDVKGTHEQREFCNIPELTFTLGEGILLDVPSGLETALLKFQNLEHSIINLAPKYGFGDEGNTKYSIPANASVEYDVKLLEFEKLKEPREMTQQEKIEKARLTKSRGGVLFAKSAYSAALVRYNEVAELMKDAQEDATEEYEMLFSAKNNITLCHIKMGDFAVAKSAAEQTLAMDSKNAKANLRMGLALFNLQEPEEALKYLKVCNEVHPNDSLVRKYIIECEKAIKVQKGKEKQLYRAMFKIISE